MMMAMMRTNVHARPVAVHISDEGDDVDDDDEHSRFSTHALARRSTPSDGGGDGDDRDKPTHGVNRSTLLVMR